jgi:hypothetical protein
MNNSLLITMNDYFPCCVTCLPTQEESLKMNKKDLRTNNKMCVIDYLLKYISKRPKEIGPLDRDRARVESTVSTHEIDMTLM